MTLHNTQRKVKIMRDYLVVRFGSNAYNQSMTNRKVCGWISAKNRKLALELAREEFSCYANQYFELIARSKVTKADSLEAFEEEVYKGIS